MDNSAAELLEIYDQLQLFVDKASKNKTIKSLEKLEEVAHAVGKSWSGSWIGYHSRIYYKEFAPIPAGAHFSSEWGRIQNIRRDTSGDWMEYQFDIVFEHIIEQAGKPDLEQAKNITKEGRILFEENIERLLSIFEIYLQRRNDPFIETIVEKAKKSKLSSGSDWIETQRPQNIMSRDSLAISQGLMTPPHISMLANIFEVRIPIYACEELAKRVKASIAHLERQERKVRRMEREGTNIFIGHGHSKLWKDLKDFIQDRLRLPWDEFNRVPVAGITNITRLSEMLDSAIFSFLIMTAEDEQSDGKLRARMNVIHEGKSVV